LRVEIKLFLELVECATTQIRGLLPGFNSRYTAYTKLVVNKCIRQIEFFFSFM